MPTHTKSKIIQSDSRGRIVLPPDIRKFGLFELEADAKTVGHYHLYPLQAKRLMEKNQQDLPAAADWNRRYDYVNKKIMPAIQTVAMAWNRNASRQKSFLIQAVTLFGSYARKDAFHNSDLDLAFFISPFPSFSDRNRIQQHFETQLESEMKLFKTMGAACDLSLIFVTENKAFKTHFPWPLKAHLPPSTQWMEWMGSMELNESTEMAVGWTWTLISDSQTLRIPPF